MCFLEEMCCLCLKKFHRNDTKFTDFKNISYFLPNVSAVIKLDEENVICETCNGTVEMICNFLKNCFKSMAILQSHKLNFKENKEKKTCIMKIEQKQEGNLKTNNKNHADEEIMLLSDTFSNKRVNEIQVLSENQMQKVVENGLDPEILLIDNGEISEEIEEVYIKEEYSTDIYEDVLEHNNQLPALAEKYMEKKIENDLDLEVLSVKIEMEEADMKKECFGDIYGNISQYRNQSSDMRVGKEFDAEIEHIPEQVRVSKEYLSTVSTEEMSFGSNEFNVSANQNFLPAKEQEVEESASSSKYECNLCKKRFTNESHFKLHDCIDKKHKSAVSETDHGQKSLYAKIRPYTCRVCNKSYKKKEQFSLHKCVHTEEKPYICSVCKKSFAIKSYLVNHERLHTGEKPFSCQICKKSFSDKSNLVKHKRLHTGEKPYSCQVCKKSFTKKSHLVYHELLHTGEKPYSCQICEKSFIKKSHLVNHERLHTGEKPYSCQVCAKSFTGKSSLVYHERLHTGEKPYTCQVCAKSFARNSDLVKHERIHTGEKPYTCQVCEKSFIEISHLVNHKRLHTGETPYSCQVCKKSFTRKSGLVYHERLHTREKPYTVPSVEQNK